jgi:hypothetical protein
VASYRQQVASAFSNNHSLLAAHSLQTKIKEITMSNRKRVSRIIIALIATIMSISIAWQTAKADVPPSKMVGIATLPGAAIQDSDWSFENADAFDYSNPMALEYASRFTDQELEPANKDVEEPVDYGANSPMVLQYVNQYHNAEPAPSSSWNFADADAFDYSNPSALEYASQYGYKQPRGRVIQVDVAEAGTRFVFDEAPVYEDGMPDYGNSFVTEGYLYPAGTLSESNGVLPNGDPEFPELVIGTWTCRGWFIGEGAYTESGPWVITTQVYDMGEEVGSEMIITEGFELSDIGIEGQRAITGGTGHFNQARGTMSQTLIGFNETMGVNLQVTLQPTR